MRRSPPEGSHTPSWARCSVARSQLDPYSLDMQARGLCQYYGLTLRIHCVLMEIGATPDTGGKAKHVLQMITR